MEKKRLDLVIRAIAEVREITPRGRHLRVDISARNGLESLHPDELELILLKLQDDEKILEIKSSPEYMYRPDTLDLDTAVVLSDVGYPALGQFEIELLDNFEQWCADYWKKRKQSSGEASPPMQGNKVVPDAEIVYQITFTKAREIFLNDAVHNIVHLLAKPSFDSENDNVFTYLYEHPNQKFTKKQIEDGVHITGIKSLHKIVENLGFQGDIKRAFFNVSEQSVQFRNSITREDLKNLHIDRIEPPK